MAWSSSISLRGTAGAQVRYGHGAPSSTNPSVQNDLDSYIDVDTGRLYAVRQNGAWPASYATLVGPQGPQGFGIQNTSGTPAASLGQVGDFALDINQALLWGPKTSSGWPTSATNLQGPSGPVGGARQYQLDLGVFWSTNGTFPTSDTEFGRPVTNPKNVVAAMSSHTPMQSAGCVRSIHGWVNGGTGGYTVTFTLYINDVATTAVATAKMTSAGVWSASFASQAYKYAVGDVLQLRIRSENSATDQSFSGFATLETLY